jgi:hypothetical protein
MLTGLFTILQKKKDYSSKYEKVIQDFYNKTFYFSYLLNYTSKLRDQ